MKATFMCRCGHTFATHHTDGSAPNSSEMPALGSCTACDCAFYSYVPVPVPAIECLRSVEQYAQLQGNARETVVTRESEERVRFVRNGLEVVASAVSRNLIELRTPSQSPRFFETDAVSPGHIVIALVEMLEAAR